ncbi:MAG: glycosyltransferase family 9 protein [Melioribacteraceae bacterium]|nr:glycosyltransferase family 9 protein [Melioribacteraceae bacterium]
MNVKGLLRILFLNAMSAFIFISLRIKFRKKCAVSQNKILFINSGLLGDNILSSLILVNDRLFYKRKDVSILLDEKYSTLFSNYTGSVKIIYYNLEKYRYGMKYRIELLKKIRCEGFEEIFNINFVRHTIDDELAVIGTCHRSYAFENNKKLVRFFEGLYTKCFSKIISLTSGNNFDELSTLIKTITSQDVFASTKLFLNQRQNKLLLDLITNKYIIIAPLSSKSVKEYHLKNYLELINHVLLNYDLSIVIVGDREIQISRTTNERLINLTGRTNLMEVLQLIKDCRVFIGNDSGLFHAAIALGKKSIGIVGGGVWGRIYPYTNSKRVHYIYKYMECFNCDWHCIYKEPKCLSEIDKIELIGLIDENIKNE